MEEIVEGNEPGSILTYSDYSAYNRYEQEKLRLP